mmetsp:Transcript_13975/g.20917  ORF Transcript_13975/g.20917 Transcript_13975/m.20917 type:complete len:83 (-) Transcript_13975:81-329(-)
MPSSSNSCMTTGTTTANIRAVTLIINAVNTTEKKRLLNEQHVMCLVYKGRVVQWLKQHEGVLLSGCLLGGSTEAIMDSGIIT